MKMLITVVTAVCSFSSAFAVEPPKIIHLKDVVFDHEGHRGECISCHDSLDGGSKISGIRKDFAHNKCIGCHTALGSGPTVCKDCHNQQR